MLKKGTCAPKADIQFFLPTYNERDNIAIVVWLLVKTFTAR